MSASCTLNTPQHPLPEYQSVRDSQAHEQHINGSQPGDPEKAAAVLLQLSEAE